MIRILIADDHAVVRRGIKELLFEEFPDARFGDASNAQEVLELLQDGPWDILLLDITMPGRSGLDLLRDLRQSWPQMPVLILSAHSEDQFAVRAFKAGALGYITKDTAAEEVCSALRKVLAGGRYVSNSLAEKLVTSLEEDHGRPLHESLSDREYEVMRLIASGKTVSQIAEQLALSVKTVSTYRSRVLEKMHLHNNAELTSYAVRNDLVG